MTPKHLYTKQKNTFCSSGNSISFKILVPSFQLQSTTLNDNLNAPFKSIVVICNPVFAILSYPISIHAIRYIWLQHSPFINFDLLLELWQLPVTATQLHEFVLNCSPPCCFWLPWSSPPILQPWSYQPHGNMVPLLCVILVIIDHWSWSSQRNASTEQ